MTYTHKIYQGQNKAYLESVPYINLKYAFMEHVNYENTFDDLVDFLEDNDRNLLQKFMIKILSNPNDWTIAELQEICGGVINQ